MNLPVRSRNYFYTISQQPILLVLENEVITAKWGVRAGEMLEKNNPTMESSTKLQSVTNKPYKIRIMGNIHVAAIHSGQIQKMHASKELS